MSDKFKVYADSVDGAVEAIKEQYSTSEVVMGEFLEDITLPYLSAVQVVSVFAKCMAWAEQDVVLHLNVNDGMVFAHGDGVSDDHLAEICQFVGNYKPVKYTAETVSIFNENFRIEVNSLASQRFIPAFGYAGEYDETNVFGESSSFTLSDGGGTEIISIEDKAINEVEIAEKLLAILYACKHDTEAFIEKIKDESFD